MKTNQKISALVGVTCALFSVTLLQSSFAADSNTSDLSPFFQDWTLDASQNNIGNCAANVSGYAGTDVPGSNGMPHTSFEASQSIRFVSDDSANLEILTLGTNPSQINDANTTVSISGNTLNVIDKKKSFFGTHTLRQDSYTIGNLGNLVVTHASGKEKSSCSYLNAHPEKHGLKAVGAILLNGGKKVAECQFASAAPRPDQVNYAYNEKCDFGKFVIKQLIDDTAQVLSTEMVANDNASFTMQLVRSTNILNNEGEVFFSSDSETLVDNLNSPTLPPVDQIYPSYSEYYINPYRQNTYSIPSTLGVVQLVYAPAQN